VNCQLRPATESDREFLYALYRDTMRQVVEQTWGWDEEWQRRAFYGRFRNCATSVVELDGNAVGGLLLDWAPAAVDIVELQILPEYQGHGIGTAIVQRVIEDAARQGLAVTLSVVPANPRARRLYERIGFHVIGVNEPFIRMRYVASERLSEA